MDFDLSATSEAWRGRLQSFFDREVLPRHRDWVEQTAFNRETPPFMGDLQAKARAAGLWNLGLPELSPDEPGTRLSNLEYAPLAEIMGRLFWAPEVFNCQAPDVPNMIALQNCATPAQKAQWLRPLLEAETRSAFGMTEPDVASSDAPRWRRLRHQRTQMVHHRCRASAMQFFDRAGRDRSGGRSNPPPFLRHRADECAGRPPGEAVALDGLRGSRRADRRNRFR
jgi:alkylation response protein AidB-like acyl-CoA dehydrogenase